MQEKCFVQNQGVARLLRDKFALYINGLAGGGPVLQLLEVAGFFRHL
jgi:hypothetical protein